MAEHRDRIRSRDRDRRLWPCLIRALSPRPAIPIPSVPGIRSICRTGPTGIPAPGIIPPAARKLFPKLIRSYALDALDASLAKETETKASSADDAAEFLNFVARVKLETFPAIGEGEDLRLSSGGLTGAALTKKERVVHLSAFRIAESTGRDAKL